MDNLVSSDAVKTVILRTRVDGDKYNRVPNYCQLCWVIYLLEIMHKTQSLITLKMIKLYFTETKTMPD
jgi:hypothetical protein